MTKKLIAATLAATLTTVTLATPASAVAYYPRAVPVSGHVNYTVPYVVFGCAASIILSALAANYRDNRQLTTEEAWSCGVLFWFSQPQTRKKGKKKP